MKFYGTYSCGHDGEIQIYGPTKDREWKAKYEFNRLCPECRELERQRQIEEKNKIAMDAAIQMGLPILTGTERQIAWATTIRYDHIKTVKRSLEAYKKDKVIFTFGSVTTEQWKAVFDGLVNNETESKFWIENRKADEIWNVIAKKCKELYFKEKE